MILLHSTFLHLLNNTVYLYCFNSIFILLLIKKQTHNISCKFLLTIRLIHHIMNVAMFLPEQKNPNATKQAYAISIAEGLIRQDLQISHLIDFLQGIKVH